MSFLKRKYFINSLFLMLAIVLVLPVGTKAASGHTFNVSADYDIAATGKVVVSQTYTVTNKGTDSLDSLKVVTPGKKINTINARYSDGAGIKTATSEGSGKSGDAVFSYTAIQLDFPRRIRGAGKSWQFTLSYVVEDALSTFGNVRSLFIPGIGQEVPKAAFSLTLRYPSAFGSPHLLPKPQRSGIESGKRFLTFNRNDLPDQTLATVFGDSANYQLSLEVPLKNNLPWYKTFKIALPPELASQKVALGDFEPPATNTTLDEEGNLYLVYRLRPLQSVTAKINLSVQVERQRYDYTKSKFVQDIPEELARYTVGTEVWPRTEALFQKGAAIVDPKLPVGDIVKALSKYVTGNLNPAADPLKLDNRPSGEHILNAGGKANALGYSDALITLLRNQEIPARLILGQAATTGLNLENNIHAWVEAYVPGVGWVVADPLWAEKFRSHETSYIDHIALNVLGTSDSELNARIPLLVPGATVSVTSGKDFKRAEGELSVSGKRYVILPGLGLESLKVTQKDGSVVDGLELRDEKRTIALGSLAPSENKTLRAPIFGTTSWQSAPVTLSAADTSLAEGSVIVVWWPFITVISVLSALIIVLQWRRLRRRKNPLAASPEVPNTHTESHSNGEQTEGIDHSASRYHE